MANLELVLECITHYPFTQILHTLTQVSILMCRELRSMQMIYCGVGGPRWRLTGVNESEPFIYIGSHGTKT